MDELRGILKLDFGALEVYCDVFEDNESCILMTTTNLVFVPNI